MANEQTQTVPDGGVDPHVFVPKHVRDAAAAADAIHKQVYEAPQPGPNEEIKDPNLVTQQDQQQVQQQEVQQAPVTATVTDGFTGAPNQQEMQDPWAQRYNSMRGRWEASQRQIGAMQQQMNDLAAELTRTQNLLMQQAQPTAHQQPQRGHAHDQLITEQDRETYGDELLDTIKRVARAEIEPEINSIRGETQDVKKRVISNDQRAIYGQLDRSVPQWKAINNDPGFKAWLSLPNIYTGQVRGQMLNAAFEAADAPKVVAIFRDFVTEVRATGGTVPGTQPAAQQQVQDQQQSRQAAVSLETLAAPGRARPAGGDTPNTPAEKPTYTRQQIAQFYADKRRAIQGQGPYAGRDADAARIEADIIAAQMDGRVRG